MKNLGIVAGPDPVAEERANKLALAVRSSGKVMADITADKWVQEFERLADVNISDRIDLVLNWYCTQLQTVQAARPLDLPVAYSAATFRRRFDDIEQAMWLYASDDHYSAPVNNIVRRLRCALWPGTTGRELPGAVDLTVNRYRGWLQRRDEAIDCSEELLSEGEGDKAHMVVLRFGRWLQQRTLQPYHFAEVWWEEVWHERSRREDFNTLTRYIFEPKCQRFMLWGYAWANEYCGRAEVWLQFTKTIAEETKT